MVDSRQFRFGDFLLDLQKGRLLKKKRPIHLRPKSFDVLAFLVVNAPRILSKQELQDAVWGRDDLNVADGSVKNCVLDIRKALGDSAKKPRFVESIPRKGYRFIWDIQKEIDTTPTDLEQLFEKYARMRQHGFWAHQHFKTDLILLAEIIFHCWHAISSGEEGPHVWLPAYKRITETADAIVERIVTDPRLRERHSLDEDSPFSQKVAVAEDILYFDRDLFIQDPTRWRVEAVNYQVAHKSKSDFDMRLPGDLLRLNSFAYLFMAVIPTMIVSAYIKFARKLTGDLTKEQADAYYTYLTKAYDLKRKWISRKILDKETMEWVQDPDQPPDISEEKKTKEVEEAWQRWRTSENSLRYLAFIERTGMLVDHTFRKGLMSKTEAEPYLKLVAEEAFPRYWISQ